MRRIWSAGLFATCFWAASRRITILRNGMVIGRRFRLAQVRIGKEEFEVSTFRRKPTQEERKGRYEDDGVMIWSDNEFGTLEDDVQRRDFTVNALYMDLVGSRGIID